MLASEHGVQWGHAVCQPWRPSLTIDLQSEHIITSYQAHTKKKVLSPAD